MTESVKNELVRTFRDNGFVFIPGFLSTSEVEAVKDRLNLLISNKVPGMPPEHAFYEDRNDPFSLKQIQLLFQYDPFFYAMMFNSKFEELASLLLDDRVIGRNMQYFNKPPLIGQATPSHQDGYYFMLKPNEAITMWLGLEDVDQFNGCVHYVKGSHLKGMRPHAKTQTLGFSQGISDFPTDDDLANDVFYSTGPGDLLAHHSLTIHWADKNNTKDRSRKALGFIYYAEKAKEDIAAKSAYQEALAKEIREKVS